MSIEVKEIIVKTTVSEENRKVDFDEGFYKWLKAEIINDLKKEQRKIEKRKRER